MSESIAIKVENLSKLYRLGEVGTGTLSHDLNRWFARIRGKENPYTKLGAENDRTKVSDNPYSWAIQDISFEIKQGDTVGIIGRNGAGKSTLLKILSRVTTPTTGRFKAKGRIASLLEVGTGFHPELTGRENIFLNGAILGMSRNEIKRKFDEIVEFSGVAKYIDTPVKRYSSGMYVRLAFAVAANLESEILVVDEVLAVGDAEFQKKCLGKMGEVSSQQGRTILFVSHNMAAVKSLCQSGIVLKNGKLLYSGTIEESIKLYASSNSNIVNKESNGFLLEELSVKNALSNDVIYSGAPVVILGKINGAILHSIPFILIDISSIYGDRLVLFSSRLEGISIKKFDQYIQFEINIDALMLMPGEYNVNVSLRDITGRIIGVWEKCAEIEIEQNPKKPALSLPSVNDRGVVYTNTQWHVNSL